MMPMRTIFGRTALRNSLKKCSLKDDNVCQSYRLHPRFSSFMIKAATDHSEVQRIPLQWGAPRQVMVESLAQDWRRAEELMELHPDVWAVYPRIDLIHANVVWQSKYNTVNYNHTKSVKEMIYTYGGGAKPWPQKGTGRARQGSRRAPQWVNGGKVHGPRGPKPLYYMLPYHIRVYGLTNILSVKFAQDDLHVVDSLDLSSDDPQDLLSLIRTRNWSPSVLFVDSEDTFPPSITTATDKLGHLNLMPVHGLNVYSMIKHHTLVLTKRAVERITDKLLFALHRCDQSDVAFRSAKGPTELSLKLEKHRPVVFTHDNLIANMTSENDDFAQVLDTVHQLVGGINTPKSELTHNIGSGKKDSAEEKWKQWKFEHKKDGELSVNDNPDEEVGTVEKEDKENLLGNTENLAPKATSQSDPSHDQDINGNPDLVLRLDYKNDFDQERSSNDCGLEEDQAEHGDHQTDDGGMIELSAYGTVDPVVMQAFDELDEAIIVKEDDGDSVCDMIDLSSDDETEENRDVSVVLLKRPSVHESVNGIANHTIQIDDSDEEFPIFLDEAEKQENFNVEEKRGYVKDFIEREGLGILSAENYGLVLFHLSHVWINGQQLSTDRVRSALTLGLWVSFYDQTLTGEQYSALSGEGVCHQAICVWTGRRPDHLLRTLDNLGPEYILSLTSSREGFLLYLSGEVFLPLALARVRGVVVGYVSENIGIIEAEDGYRNKVNVFFHTDHVWIFKKPLRQYQEDFNCCPGRLLPAGLAVSVDARRVKIPEVDSLNYQAVCVLGGTWPEVPAPTLLPGGPGTYTAAYDVPEDSTFYYLELSLEAKLSQKIECLQDVLQRSRGSIKFDWRHVNVINNAEDKDKWRSQFTRAPRRPKAPRDDSYIQDRRRVKHMFKAPPARIIKTKKELDDSSSVATAGSSARGYISDVDSHMSRPLSRASSYSESNSTSSRSKRDWYNPNFWKHGGLRIKTEIKSELV